MLCVSGRKWTIVEKPHLQFCKPHVAEPNLPGNYQNIVPYCYTVTRVLTRNRQVSHPCFLMLKSEKWPFWQTETYSCCPLWDPHPGCMCAKSIRECLIYPEPYLNTWHKTADVANDPLVQHENIIRLFCHWDWLPNWWTDRLTFSNLNYEVR